MRNTILRKKDGAPSIRRQNCPWQPLPGYAVNLQAEGQKDAADTDGVEDSLRPYTSNPAGGPSCGRGKGRDVTLSIPVREQLPLDSRIGIYLTCNL